MRGSLMRLFTQSKHVEVLTEFTKDKDAAEVYTALVDRQISPQLVRYWRSIFITNGGNLSKTDRELKEVREFVKPQPDDDFGRLDFIPKCARSILVIPDQHAPYHHPDMIPFLVAVRESFDPDLVVNLGDELDHHALSFHDSDPNLDSAGAELERAKVVMRELHDEFPDMLICHSNHGSMHFRRAKAHGIPVQMVKGYREILFPDRKRGKGWNWAYAWRVETPLGTVMFKHQASGTILADAAHNACNLVVGHQHGNYSVEYSASSAHLYWGMYCGCLIDKDSYAFAYGKHSLRKPVIGCAVILEGRPMLIPMVLGADGRWVGSL